MKRYPLVAITVSFILGIILDNSLPIHPLKTLLVVYIIPLLIGCALFFHRRRYLRSLICIIVLIITGALYHHYRFYSYPINDIANLIPPERSLARLRGVIIQPPVQKRISRPYQGEGLHREAFRKEGVWFLLKANKIKGTDNWEDVSGNIRVNLYSYDHHGKAEIETDDKDQSSRPDYNTPSKLQYGDEVELVGKISIPRPPTNPGQFDYRKYLERYEPPVRAVMSVTSLDNVILLSKDRANPFLSFIYSLKNGLHDAIYSVSPRSNAAIITSLLLGEREDVDQEVVDNFIKTGTIHFLAISGLHVGILVISIHIIFRAAGLNRKAAAYIIIALVVLYAILTGMKPPVLRASIMVIVYYGAIILNRRWGIASGMAAAALLTLLRNPCELFGVSFQLSFLATIGIVCFSSRIESLFYKPTHLDDTLDRSKKRIILRSLRSYCQNTIAVSLSAWLSVSPIVAYYFHIIAPISIPLNIIILPLIWLILVSGFVFLLIHPISPFLAMPFAWIASYSDILMEKIVSTLSIKNISFFYTSGPSAIWLIIYYGMGIMLFYYKQLRLKPAHMIILALAISNIYIFSGLCNYKDERLKLTCLDVGHGSAIFFEFPGGKNLLFDAGTWANFDIGRNVVAPFLWRTGIEKIDCVVISHDDADHWNGIPSLLERFKIGVILVNKVFSSSEVGKRLLKMARSKGARIKLIGTGDDISGFGKAMAHVLNPPKASALISHLSANDTSCVLKIDYLGYSILSCADIEESGIRSLLQDQDADLRSHIILVPHHGGYSQNIGTLIKRVKPVYAFISAKQGFPSKATIDSCLKHGAQAFQTAQDGALIAVIDKKGINISTWLQNTNSLLIQENRDRGKM